MAMRRLRAHREAADLDMTPFISLLVALVPFLLVSVVFSHITVLDLKLPGAASGGNTTDIQNEEVELVIRADHLEIDYPRGVLLKSISDTAAGVHDYAMLSTVLQEVKRQLKEKTIDKKSITILSEANTPYQTIVTTMDTARSFKTTIATSVVDAELFPDIAFGDAPAVAGAVADATAINVGAAR
ncbi:MAG TPA: biopolymer transporter ExbD [Spongiibacteraceae bacterium]|nr:biopolymer transporter ExbD [Spongiibacteraceae bacterium]